ncbi:fatty acid--CoA ligase family protein [Streptomyces yunnanensis]|uniref:Fatty acid--CoA ligase family protein n=1 Tax=Streptomyces yunnanensis TaxID=156453 RepID=A0ABY8AF42_9ACTN|nr:fatty acid--CoA ligase family protein [Streptomyces yunnanensis]WEB42132.1 fatty acid--CoA ligase family protein [Streptomyces yunnanensis]
MSSGRQALVMRILAQGVHVNGERIDATGSPFLSLCDRLGRAGVRPGEIAVLAGLQGRDLIVATLAVWRLDAVPMPVPEPAPALDGVPDRTVREACRITPDLSVTPATTAPDQRGAALDRTAVLHLSSGSTDRPKVAQRGVASVLYDAQGYRAGLGLVPGDCVAVPVPLAHSFGWGVAMSALISGCDIDVTPFVRASSLARKADSGAVSVLALTPPLARLLTDTRRQGGDATLRAAMAGAGQVPDELEDAFRERFGLPLLRGYGSTETGGTFFGDRGMGRPVPGVDIVQPLPGQRGELVLRLAAPLEGYLGEDQGPAAEWHTGDIVQLDTDGIVHFQERVRGPLRLNGRFIQADATEAALRAVPGVTDVFLLVLPRSDTPETEDFYAVVEGDSSEEGLLAALAGCPAGTPVPRVVVFRELPRTAVGKRDRGMVIDKVRKVSRCA